MAYDETKYVTLGGLKIALTQIKDDYLSHISDAGTGHLAVEIVETVPEAAAAAENTLYLYLNSETTRYESYMLINGVVEALNDAASGGTITSSDIASDDEVNEMVAEILGASDTGSDTGDDTGDDNTDTGDDNTETPTE